MKKTILMIALGLIVCSLSYAQSWSSGTGVIYANPITTKVGIGTSSPQYQFHLYDPLRPDFCIGNPSGSLRLSVASAAGEFAPISVAGDAVFNLVNPTGGVHAGLIFNFNNDDNDGNRFVKFCDSYKTIMAIYNNATVKIDGKLFAKEIEVKTNVWADFVFKPDYKLMPLNELEGFIKANNHLPNVPTEAEVKTKGVNVAEMNAKLLQKVEELTLYVIELKKENDKLAEKVNYKK